ncbi:STAS domain-containing protein [Streptomyces sp. NP160]|uniref:STAS domain-containing protein n=1 Tax=Streptomyces sp. NP160 TaxID=2586637 RepID=UPI00111A57DB|nr:STAS domain-containing protein [Streptomyces sp. NP160]TNM68127.1 STAS domain-containing protein [Streptomyces sp. NP160]
MGDQSLHVLLERQADALVLTVVGEVDLYSVPVLSAAALDALQTLQQAGSQGRDEDRPCLVLDLEAVSFMDSAGLGVLVGVLRRAKQQGVTFSLVAPQAAVMSLLHITGLTGVMPIWDDVAAAMAHCQRKA